MSAHDDGPIVTLRTISNDLTEVKASVLRLTILMEQQQETSQDHEPRLRALETFKSQVRGVSVFASAVVLPAIAALFYKVFV